MTPSPGRVLGIGLGQARIGVALSDAAASLAQPLTTLPARGTRADLRRIRELIEQHGVETIVIGLPLLLSGEEGREAARARERAAREACQPPRGYPYGVGTGEILEWGVGRRPLLLIEDGKLRAARPSYYRDACRILRGAGRAPQSSPTPAETDPG